MTKETEHCPPEVTEGDADKSERVARGVYLLPNLLTTFTLFAGFYSLVVAMKGNFEAAAIAIFVAMIADGLDGRVARLTNTQTPFGAEYDSLSDMVAFGVAPSLVIYNWSLASLGKLGWVAAFLYTAAVALRLARFNVQVTDKRFFKGLPCPSAAGIVASIIWLGSNYQWTGKILAVSLGLLMIAVACLMVSTVRYSSFKSIDFKDRVPFLTIVSAVFLLAAVALEPPEMLFTLFAIYLLSGPLMTWWEISKAKHRTPPNTQVN